MKAFLCLIAIVQATFLFSQNNKQQNISYSVISSVNHTFGYEIFLDGKKFISQKSVPGLQGNNGFSQKSQAELVAKLVITKIVAGQMPPTVTIDELKKIKALPQ
jgi:hypothetical protein